MSEPEECCVLCGAAMHGIHDMHNPWPLSGKGRCCSICNDIKVIPARIAVYTSTEETEENGQKTKP